MNKYTYIDLYNLNTYSVKEFKSQYHTYRKLKEIPHYFIFTETKDGVKPVIVVKNNNDEIQLYAFNYHHADLTGVDIILDEPLTSLFDECSYIYVYEDYNECMNNYLQKRKDYLNSCKQLIIEEITKLEQERTIKAYEERERLMSELEKRIMELLDVYDTHIIHANAKLNRISERINQIDEMSDCLKK